MHNNYRQLNSGIGEKVKDNQGGPEIQSRKEKGS
jgi:hypothetical protein